MKKSLLISLATTLAAGGAMAQGSLGAFQSVFDSYGFTVGPGETTSAAAGSSYYTGNVDIELLYSSTATAGTVTALNALDGTAGVEAAATADGFAVVSTTTLTGSQTGIANGTTYALSGGEINISGSSPLQEIGLTTVPTSGTGIIALEATVVGGADNGFTGLVAWGGQAFGGNPTTHPAGQDSPVNTDAAGENLDMVGATPEPTTLAFAGLGGLSLLLFRRRS